MWSKIVMSAGALLHWLTGWIVHADKGGCTCMSDKDVFEKISDPFDDVDN